MARTDSVLLQQAGPLVPSMGTFPSSANTLYPKGTIVTRSSAGRAVSPSTADVSGNPAVGVAKATFINTTGAEMGGLDDSGFVETDYGVHFFSYVGTAPITGQVLYVVDNQTVSTDPSTGRGVAGICTEVRTLNGVAKAGCFMGPAASSEAVATAGAYFKEIPLGALRLSTGAAIPAFSNGVADGFQLTDSEALGLRINDDSTTTFTWSGILYGHDDAQDLVLHLVGFRVGTVDMATALITVGAFFQGLGDADSADADAGGASSAFGAATTILSEATRTLAAADVPAGPCNVTLTFTVGAGMTTDDLVILGMYLTGARK